MKFLIVESPPLPILIPLAISEFCLQVILLLALLKCLQTGLPGLRYLLG